MTQLSFRINNLTTFQAALAACIVMGGAILPSLAYAADDVSNRLNRIEREIDTLNQAVYKGKMPAVSSSTGGGAYQSNVEVRLSDIENQIRDLTGKIEKQNYDLSQMKQQLDRAVADMDLRMNSNSQMPSGMAQSGTLAPNDMGGPVLSNPEPMAPSVSPDVDYDAPAPSDSPTQQKLGSLTQSPGGAAIPPTAGNDPAGQYEMAFSLLKNGNYAASRNGFDEFLRQYPDHPLSGNAMYWLGENFYAEGNYDKATRVFAEGYKKYPKSPKAADSLLKMGMSLGKAGKTQQACVTFDQLKKQFPAGNNEIMRLADQEKTKLGCGG